MISVNICPRCWLAVERLLKMKTTAEAAVFLRIITCAVQQRLIPRPFEVDELFDETTLKMH